jgi:hypothetical protein
VTPIARGICWRLRQELDLGDGHGDGAGRAGVAVEPAATIRMFLSFLTNRVSDDRVASWVLLSASLVTDKWSNRRGVRGINGHFA